MAATDPAGYRTPASIRARLDRMEYLLEHAVRIPGTNKRLGADVLLNILPFGGTVIAAAMGTYIAWEARNLGVSKWTVTRMAGNIGFDMLLGAIPFVGAIPDYFFRSNSRNLRLVRKWLDKHHPAALAGSAP